MKIGVVSEKNDPSYYLNLAKMNNFTEDKSLTKMGNPDMLLDCRLLSSPIPCIKFRYQMSKLAVDQVLTLLVTDRLSIEYIPKWCERTGNDYLELPCKCGMTIFLVRCQKKLN